MLKITRGDYNIIRTEAETSYPNECCGILLGSLDGNQRVVTMIWKCENVRTDSHVSFSIGPQQLVNAQRFARGRGEDIVGFYHSHPNQSPQCSKTDLEEAHWFDCSYMIIRAEKGHAADMNCFVLIGSERNKQFHKERVEFVADYPLPIAL